MGSWLTDRVSLAVPQAWSFLLGPFFLLGLKLAHILEFTGLARAQEEACPAAAVTAWPLGICAAGH